MYWSLFIAGRIYEDFLVKGGLNLPVGASYSRQVFATREEFDEIVSHLRAVIDVDKYSFKEMPLEDELGFLLIIQRLADKTEEEELAN